MTTLAGVLAEHQIEDNGFACTGCTWRPHNPTVTDCEEFAAHQAEVIAAAGLVVVPAPDAERVAEAICDADFNNTEAWNKSINSYGRDCYRRMAAAAIKAVIS